MDIFKLVGSVFVDTEGADKSLQKVGKSADDTGSKFGAIASGAGKMALGVATAAGAIATAIGTKAVQAAKDFEVSFAKVNTLLDDTTDLDAYKKSIVDLSNQMGKSTGDISEAVYSAISAGVDSSKAVEFTANALKLAEGGFTDAATAVDVVTTALNAYGLETEKATQISDYLITTQNLGKTTVGELASSVGKVIPVASAYGVEMDNLSTAYAQLTAGGIATAEAGTSLKAMLSELGKSSSKVAGILKEKTGKSFAELTADGSSLGDVLQILGDSVDGDAGKFNELWSSSVAGVGALSLLNSGSEAYNETLEKMRDSAGATDEAFGTMHDTFEAQMETLKTNIDNVLIQIGTALMPVAMEVVDWITEHLPEIQAVLEKVFDVFSVIVDAVVKAIIWVKDNFGQYFPVIEDFVKKAFEGIKKLWDEDLKPMFDALIDFVVNVLLPIWDFVFTHGIKPVIEAVFKYIGDMWNGTLKPIFYNIIDFIKNIFSGNFTGAFQNIFNIVGGLFNGFVSLVKIPLNSVIGIVNSFIKSINKLKIPDWIPLIGGSSPDLPTIPLLAKGGNVTSRGSAIVGEAGAELVDLPRGASVTPLGGKGAGGNIEGLLAEMVELMQRQEAMMYRAVSLALKDGIDVDFDSRNLARLIKRYA